MRDKQYWEVGRTSARDDFVADGHGAEPFSWELRLCLVHCIAIHQSRVRIRRRANLHVVFPWGWPSAGRDSKSVDIAGALIDHLWDFLHTNSGDEHCGGSGFQGQHHIPCASGTPKSQRDETAGHATIEHCQLDAILALDVCPRCR